MLVKGVRVRVRVWVRWCRFVGCGGGKGVRGLGGGVEGWRGGGVCWGWVRVGVGMERGGGRTGFGEP